MSAVDTIIQHAERQCKAHGARLTAKRKRLLAGLIQSKKALSAYDLVEYFKSEYGEDIPAMSVYRILDFLVEEGLVHKLSLANKYVACAHICDGGLHGTPQFLICSECNRVEEINIDTSTVAELHKTVSDAGFELRSPQVEFECVCDRCVD